eukprot:NODE_7957_length_430_cov_56.905512_g7097_i0.p1 GENE.NODE_7957_length_430_cov_56.905512_g7097_i0~~NODE_7957_length_430_cov_56.905512_g7097_i0.p1  ORF type:complete len:101 (-),score=36.15 NODE_7957_length_430_cov_56.905512_g7097_i0:126-404(-)
MGVTTNCVRPQFPEWWVEVKGQLHTMGKVLAEKGIFHGDINTENVLVTQTEGCQRSVKIIDFSDAHLSDDAEEYTEWAIESLIETVESGLLQ